VIQSVLNLLPPAAALDEKEEACIWKSPARESLRAILAKLSNLLQVDIFQ